MAPVRNACVLGLFVLAAGCAATDTEDPAADDGSSSAAGSDTNPSGTSGTVDPTSPSTSAGPGGNDGSTSGPGGSDGDGSDDSSTGEPGGPPPGLVPAFIAQGHMGRTMLSCDDGQTWIADVSLDDTIRCFEGIDCDHDEGAATGLTATDGLLVATWGWGTEGRIATSPDGVEWTDVLTGPTFAGTAFGNDTFIAGARSPWRAGADAATWEMLPDSGLDEWTPRGTGFVPHEGGIFLIGGGGGGSSDLVLSSTDGDDWWHPDSFPPTCGDSIRGIAYGGGTIVIARGANDGAEICVSTDGGLDFTGIDLADSPSSPVVWTGDEFVVFAGGTRYASTDGQQWSSSSLGNGISVGAMARSPDGTFIGHRDGWMVWYEQQQLYRSVDGVDWQPLGAGAFVGGHPIRHMRFGYVHPHAEGC